MFFYWPEVQHFGTIEKQIMNKLNYCKKCILPSTRPNISYNLKTGLCSVCTQITKSNIKISWKKRKKEFEKIVKKVRAKNHLYD